MSNLRIVSLGTLLSRVLGLIRDMAMAALFGAGTILDTFIVAFRIPNLTRQLFGEGALTTAFLPVFLRNLEEQGEATARSTLTATAVVLTAGLTLLVLLIELVVLLLWVLLPLQPSTRLLCALLMIMLPYLVLICLSALFCAGLHSLRQFLWPALVPVVLNVVWLTAAFLSLWLTEGDEQRALIIAAGITVAGVLQMWIPIRVLRSLGMGLTPDWRDGLKSVGEVFRTMVPVVAGMTVLQISSLLDSLLAWGLASPDHGGRAPVEVLGLPALLESGTAAALYYGQRMYQFPLGVFGVALGTVIFPLLTQHAQRQEWELLRADFSRGLRLMIAVALPASAGLFILAEPLTVALFQRGRFNARDALLTAQMIAAFASGVWIYIGLSIVNRAFYATGDRLTPMRLGLISLAANLLLSLVLVVSAGGIGLAVGNVLACGLQLALSLRILHRQLGPFDWNAIISTLIRCALATGIMTLACWLILGLLPPAQGAVARFAVVLLPCLGGAAVYWLAARLLRIREVQELLDRS